MAHIESSVAGRVAVAGLALAMGTALVRPHVSSERNLHHEPTPTSTPTTLFMDTPVPPAPTYEVMDKPLTPEPTRSSFENNITELRFLLNAIPLSTFGNQELGLEDVIYNENAEQYFAQGGIVAQAGDPPQQSIYDVLLFDTKEPIRLEQGNTAGDVDTRGVVSFLIGEGGGLRQSNDTSPTPPLNELESYALEYFDLPTGSQWTFLRDEDSYWGAAQFNNTTYSLRIDVGGNITFTCLTPNAPARDIKKIS